MAIVHFILGKADPERMNGVNQVVHHLASAQARAGHEVQIWGVTPTPGRMPACERPATTRLFQARSNRFLLDPALFEALRQVSPQTVFHLHGGFLPENWRFAQALLRHNFYYVLTAHGSYNKVAMERSARQKKIYWELFEKRFIQQAHRVHCLGQSEQDALLDLLPAVDTVLIPNGQAPVSGQASRRWDLPVFGFVGRLDRYTKGLDVLVEGFARYRQAGHPGKLVLIGDGQDQALVRGDLRERGLLDDVEMRGPAYGQAKLDQMLEFDAFIHPSRNEGMPTAVLEAAALGLPVVISRETNLADYVSRHGAGLVLPQNNAEAMEACLVQAGEWRTKPGQQQALRQAALAMWRAEFNWDHIGQQLAAVALQGRAANQPSERSWTAALGQAPLRP